MEWPITGHPPTLSNRAFVNTIEELKKDQCRAVGRKEVKKLLNNAKIEVVHKKGTSVIIVGSSSTHSLKNM